MKKSKEINRRFSQKSKEINLNRDKLNLHNIIKNAIMKRILDSETTAHSAHPHTLQNARMQKCKNAKY